MKLLLYCTKGKPYLNDYRLNEYCNKFVTMSKPVDDVNGKIVGECDYEIEEIEQSIVTIDGYGLRNAYETKSMSYSQLLNKSCLSEFEILNYLKDKNGYAIHIKNLHIYDEPRDLFHYTCVKGPQNMQYVYSSYDKDRNALISIQPQWLCKILNGEKTIEIRKKVLKGMIENENRT